MASGSDQFQGSMLLLLLVFLFLPLKCFDVPKFHVLFFFPSCLVILSPVVLKIFSILMTHKHLFLETYAFSHCLVTIPFPNTYVFSGCLICIGDLTHPSPKLWFPHHLHESFHCPVSLKYMELTDHELLMLNYCNHFLLFSQILYIMHKEILYVFELFSKHNALSQL